MDFPLDENKFLLSVKRGDYDLDYLLKRADEFEPLFELAYQESKLRHSPDSTMPIPFTLPTIKIIVNLYLSYQ